MSESENDAPMPMGAIDTLDVGEKKLTIQTEFFPRPEPRFETKVYLGGALKKIYKEVVDDISGDLQVPLNSFHRRNVNEIFDGLQRRKQ